MKKTIIILVAAMVAFTFSGVSSYASLPSQAAPQLFGKKAAKDIKTVTLSANIHCKNCAKKVQENIGFEKGVEGLEVSVEKRQVVIKYNAAKTDVETLLAAMKKIGFPATVVEPQA